MVEFSIAALSHSTKEILPLLVLLVTGLVLMLMDAFKKRKPLTYVAVAGLGISALLAFLKVSEPGEAVFSGMYQTGGLASLVHVFLCLSALFTFFFLRDYFIQQNKIIPDAYALTIFAVMGMVLMANARDLLMTFIGLETMSICLYILAALYKRDPRSNEAGLKYFLLGAFASAFLLFGIALIYGVSGYQTLNAQGEIEFIRGSTNFQQLALNLSELTSPNIPLDSPGLKLQERIVLMMVGFGFILVGFLFKVSAFPFHNWAPDVYTGTPTPLAGFMATGGKMAAFIALGTLLIELRVLSLPRITHVLALSAVLSIIYGNFVAARQSNLKRMLAYSSIAHSGYVLLGLCVVGVDPKFFSAVIFYMVIYLFMNIGAFGMVSMVGVGFEDTELARWKGLGKRAPIYAGFLAVFMLSLAGIPPLAGFMAKYLVFLAAIRADFIWLAIIGILASVAGAFYYLRVVITLFSGEEAPMDLLLDFGIRSRIGVALLAFLVVLLGFFPSLLLNTIEGAMEIIP